MPRKRMSPSGGDRTFATVLRTCDHAICGQLCTVQPFGAKQKHDALLHDDPIHRRRRLAYEKRQWTKSREVGRQRRNALYGGLTATPTLMLADGTSRDEVDGPSSE